MKKITLEVYTPDEKLPENGTKVIIWTPANILSVDYYKGFNCTKNIRCSIIPNERVKAWAYFTKEVI